MATDSRLAIISASDETYFPLLRGLLDSLRASMTSGGGPFARSCVIDLGMTGAQLDELHARGVQTAAGRWDFDFPAQPSTPRHFQGLTGRPFLRDYFPGNEMYLWLDADTWLQDRTAIDLLVSGAARHGLAVVPEIHCFYPYLWGQGTVPQVTMDGFGQSFGEEAARFMAGKPIVNAGVFAMSAASPWWEPYRRLVEHGFRAAPHKWTEQGALNLALHEFGRPFQMLPAWCNWICCYALPALDVRRGCLCEPMAPFQKLSLIHLAGANRPGLRLVTTDGEPVEIPLDYHGFRQGLSRITP